MLRLDGLEENQGEEYMSIEPSPKKISLHIEEITEDALKNQLALPQYDGQPVVEIFSPVSEWGRLRVALLILRASNKAPFIIIEPSKDEVTPELALELVCFLKNSDQLFLQNIMSICGHWIPEEFKKDFELESKIELKWFWEWYTANFDSNRLARYPGLPWLAFIRKLVLENYSFAEKLIAEANVSEESTHLDQDLVHGVEFRNFLRSFLKARKKTVALFPKKWSRLQ